MDIQEAIKKFKDYLLLEKGRSELTWQNYENDIHHFLTQFKPVHEIEEITNDDLAIFLRFEITNGLSAATINRRVCAMRQFLLFCNRKHLMDIEITDIATPKKQFKLPNVLTEQQISRLFSVYDEHKPNEVRDVIFMELLYGAGLRLTEAVDLQIRDISFTHEEIKINGKGARQRIIPLDKYTLNRLNFYIRMIRPRIYVNAEDNKYVFLSREGNHISRVQCFKSVKKFAKRAGLPDFVSPHTLRHCYATHLLEHGAAIEVVQQLLGHEELSTTGIYTHVATRKMRTAYDTAFDD